MESSYLNLLMAIQTFSSLAGTAFFTSYISSRKNTSSSVKNLITITVVVLAIALISLYIYEYYLLLSMLKDANYGFMAVLAAVINTLFVLLAAYVMYGLISNSLRSLNNCCYDNEIDREVLVNDQKTMEAPLLVVTNDIIMVKVEAKIEEKADTRVESVKDVHSARNFVETQDQFVEDVNAQNILLDSNIVSIKNLSVHAKTEENLEKIQEQLVKDDSSQYIPDDNNMISINELSAQIKTDQMIMEPVNSQETPVDTLKTEQDLKTLQALFKTQEQLTDEKSQKDLVVNSNKVSINDLNGAMPVDNYLIGTNSLSEQKIDVVDNEQEA